MFSVVQEAFVFFQSWMMDDTLLQPRKALWYPWLLPGEEELKTELGEQQISHIPFILGFQPPSGGMIIASSDALCISLFRVYSLTKRLLIIHGKNTSEETIHS